MSIASLFLECTSTITASFSSFVTFGDFALDFEVGGFFYVSLFFFDGLTLLSILVLDTFSTFTFVYGLGDSTT